MKLQKSFHWFNHIRMLILFVEKRNICRKKKYFNYIRIHDTTLICTFVASLRKKILFFYLHLKNLISLSRTDNLTNFLQSLREPLRLQASCFKRSNIIKGKRDFSSFLFKDQFALTYFTYLNIMLYFYYSTIPL